MNIKKNNNTKSGFIKIVLLVLVALILLKYIYGVDVVGFFTQGKFKEILDKSYSWISAAWNRYNDVIMKIWNWTSGVIKTQIGKI